ncbi:MAG: c-type cytochrome [Anaerolineae bacterium]|nr:c-type cytochrome [Anaerolineae bacterium]
MFLVIGLSLLFALPAYAQSPDTQPAVSGGRGLWSENCAPCHGPTGAGDGPTSQSIENGVPSFLDPEVYRANAPVEHFDIIKNGRIENLMPPWGGRFDDAQIWDLTAYVWSLHTTPDDLVKGAEIYTERCAACHGEGGAGDGVQAAVDMNNLADLQIVSQQSLDDWHSGFADTAAHAEISDLSDEDLWLALDHIRTFSFAVPQRNGILSGQIINGTTNEPQGDLEVTLYTFSGNTAVEEHTAQADSDGNYRFENLSTDPEVMYVVEGRFDDVSYLSQPSPFPDDNNTQKLDLDVYETTTDEASISLSRLNNLVSFMPKAVRVIELFVLGNDGDKTYVGQGGSSFTFDLPDNATNVSFQNDLSNRFVEAVDGGGYTTNEPIFPGEEGLVIVAVYDLPYDSDTLSVEMPIPADVESVSMLMELQPDIELVSQQFQFVERRTLQNSEFGTYNAQNLKEGDVLTFEISGLDNLTFETPAPSNAPAGSVAAPPSIINQDVVRWIVLGLGGVAIVLAAFLYPSYRPRLVHTDDDPARRRQRLLLLLARLDETHAAGEIDEQVYRQARAEYKAELMRLMKVESGD